MNNDLLIYPQRVYNVLKLCEEQGREDIISWVNEGTAFKVNDVQKFERDVLPNYFNTKKYYSFTRRLYAYGFTCVRMGRQTGIYSHPSFNRNDPIAPSLMKRVAKKGSRKEAATPNHNHHDATISEDPFIDEASLSIRREDHNDDDDDDNDDTATFFGREYHTIVACPQAPNTGADRATNNLPDCDSLDTRSAYYYYPNPTNTSSTSMTASGSYRNGWNNS